jgi:hypothetical protein
VERSRPFQSLATTVNEAAIKHFSRRILSTIRDSNVGRFFSEYLYRLKWDSRRREGDKMTVFLVETYVVRPEKQEQYMALMKKWAEYIK